MARAGAVPMLTATCHCGAVQIELPRRPRVLTTCNCSICRRYGTLWAYYLPDAIRVSGSARDTARYAWGRKTIRFVRCRRCGCVTHYERTWSGRHRKIGVNARNVDPAELGPVRIRRLDGASTWKYLD